MNSGSGGVSRDFLYLRMSRVSEFWGFFVVKNGNFSFDTKFDAERKEKTRVLKIRKEIREIVPSLVTKLINSSANKHAPLDFTMNLPW